MTPSHSPPPPTATDPSVPEALEGLIARAVSADGRSPFSALALAQLGTGTRRLIWAGDAAALVSATEAEFVVDPDYRRRGQGGRNLNLLLTGAGGELFVWAHGGHPDAIALAASRGLQPVREVLHLRSAVDATSLASLPKRRTSGPEIPVSGPHGAVSLHFSVISEGVAAEVAAL
jgi:mycothiol synthase